MNKYHKVLQSILAKGQSQANKKGDIKYLMNEVLSMTPLDLDVIFKEHKIARKKLAQELRLYCEGVIEVKEYNRIGIKWWDYCAPTLINSYPSYFKQLPALLDKINKEKRSSKNYVLFIGDTNKPTNQLPCLSLIQFQISNGKLFMTIYQRSADCSLGLPSDIYQMFLISQLIDLELANITFFIGNAHIYKNNIQSTERLLTGESTRFELNV